MSPILFLLLCLIANMKWNLDAKIHHHDHDSLYDHEEIITQTDQEILEKKMILFSEA